MKLTFLGTRGEIEARTRRHRMHSSLRVSCRGAKVMIDCGLDWLGKFERLHPDAIVLTHAHPDHAWGLKNGAPCPVHAPRKTWHSLRNCQVEDRHPIKERLPTKICGVTFEPFPVEHSILAPAVAYRVSAGRARILYGPDLLFIHDRVAALKDVQAYIGDGATLTRSLIRRRGKSLIGHSLVPILLDRPAVFVTRCRRSARADAGAKIAGAVESHRRASSDGGQQSERHRHVY